MALKATKPERLETRIAPTQKRLIQRAADLRGTTVTDFVVSSAHAAAIETIRDFEMLELRDKDRNVFVSALLNPPRPNKAARKAAARYRQRMGL